LQPKYRVAQSDFQDVAVHHSHPRRLKQIALENSARHRTTHYCCELAAAAIQAVLEQAAPEEGIRTSASLYGNPEVGSNNGGG
jgi:hypothetical protein